MRQIFVIILFCFLAPSAIAKGYDEISIDHNIQRPGGDYTHFTATNAQECAENCARSSRCQAFDFHKSDHSCWLKNTVYPGRSYAGVVSGAKLSSYSGSSTAVESSMNLRYDTQRPGGDYTRFQSQSVHECAQQCAADSRCSAFDYTTSDSFCYLKNWIPSARRYRGVVSGVKKQHYPMVKAVQELLMQLGYNPGSPDGLMGRKTKNALKNYQEDQQLLVTGLIDDATLISLGLRQSSSQFSRQPSYQTSPPLSKNKVEKERWGSSSGQQVSEVSPMPAFSAEGQTQEIFEEEVKDDLLLYVKTVGVTYLQLADNIYANILAKIPADTVLQVLSEKGEWVKVSYQNQIGYVLTESVQKQ